MLLLAFAGPWAPMSRADAPIVPAGAELELLWNDGEFTEGVAVAPDGRIYFSDIARDKKPGRILVFDPRTGKTRVFCADSGKSNGLMFDRNGRLIAACGANYGKRAICEVRPDGTLRVIVDRYQGKRLNSPNDLVIHPDGSIYFSDPRYIGPEPMELDHMSVYRLAPDGTLTRVTFDIEKPNGVALSPDLKTLYVAETNNGTTHIVPGVRTEPGRMTLNAFPVRRDGSLGRKRVLVDFGKELGTDGMTVDTQGRIYAAVRSERRHGIVVFSPQGKELAYIPTEPLPTNCCFGNGPEIHTLYITAGTGLYRIRLNATGFHPATAPWPPRRER
ncbi:MAG: SMP-30/gluconolactonase/LRE family protein [Planctomycetota bacterium]|nr:MAG: SMP-30/gluconolactonase/LRE family protein [Planctomycetota bacterium]